LASSDGFIFDPVHKSFVFQNEGLFHS